MQQEKVLAPACLYNVCKMHLALKVLTSVASLEQNKSNLQNFNVFEK